MSHWLLFSSLSFVRLFFLTPKNDLSFPTNFSNAFRLIWVQQQQQSLTAGLEQRSLTGVGAAGGIRKTRQVQTTGQSLPHPGQSLPHPAASLDVFYSRGSSRWTPVLPLQKAAHLHPTHQPKSLLPRADTPQPARLTLTCPMQAEPTDTKTKGGHRDPLQSEQPSLPPVTPRPFWTICTDTEFYWKRYPIMTYRL